MSKPIELVERRPIRLSPWTVYEGYCAMRVVEGADPNVVANGMAFIANPATCFANGQTAS